MWSIATFVMGFSGWFFFTFPMLIALNPANETLKSAGYEKPRIAIDGINPYCGENGMFGNGEEEEELIPAIKKANKKY